MILLCEIVLYLSVFQEFSHCSVLKVFIATFHHLRSDENLVNGQFRSTVSLLKKKKGKKKCCLVMNGVHFKPPKVF